MKVRLGHSSKNETRVARHPRTGLVCDPADGGVFPPKMPITPVKYPGEARVCAGACMYKVPEDTPGRYELQGYSPARIRLHREAGGWGQGLRESVRGGAGAGVEHEGLLAQQGRVPGKRAKDVACR